MYGTYSNTKMVSRLSLTILLALLMFSAFGCNSTNESNSDFSLSPQISAESNWNDQSDNATPAIEKRDPDTKPTDCLGRGEGYVTFRNRFRCEPVQVLVDGHSFAFLEPQAGLCTPLPAGKHVVAFAHFKSREIIREQVLRLKPCHDILFATDDDFCYEAKD